MTSFACGHGWDMAGCGQKWAWLDAVGQSDCSILESAISQEQIYE